MIERVAIGLDKLCSVGELRIAVNDLDIERRIIRTKLGDDTSNIDFSCIHSRIVGAGGAIYGRGQLLGSVTQ